MAKIKYNVCVVTVTYGNRWNFLKQVLTQTLSFAEVAQIVVVNNASGYNVEENVKEFNSEKITVLNNTENLGSAGGYKQGINYAGKNSMADFIWLLDDDNVAEANVLTNLLNAWDEIEGANNKKALFCLREDRAAHIKIAQGESPNRYYLVPDNFMGFHIFNILNNQYYKFRDKFGGQKQFKKYVQMPYVPYGGLLMHQSILTKIGLPNEAFYLYVDDSEYSYRITQNNGAIWLVPSCKIIDVDQSQGLNYQPKLFHSRLLDQWNFRTFYAVRNRLYFYSRVAVKNKLMFGINKTLYLMYLKITSLLSSNPKQYQQFLAAVNDGLEGRLGKANPQKFE
jgi:GT2 family glycosyltransferase